MKPSIILFALVMILCPVKTFAIDPAPPKDVPTIEALISLHKRMKKAEDKALTQAAAYTAEQSLTTKITKKAVDIKSILDRKISDAHSYIIFASSMTTTVLHLSRLIEQYKNFTTKTAGIVTKKPFVAWYYADANLAIAREIKHAQKLYATVAASGINLMKASMDEKMNLVMSLKDTIENARRIIDNANLWCYLMTNCGWKPDYIWEILTSDVKDEIVGAVINKWNQ